jgi:hypothetical protein
MAQEEESGPNGPHPKEVEGDPAVTSSAGAAAARGDSDGGDEGSGPNGPHVEAAASSGPNGPHPK